MTENESLIEIQTESENNRNSDIEGLEISSDTESDL